MIWHLILDYWWLVLWIAAAAFVAVKFGWKSGLIVLTLGAAAAIYNKGRKDAETAIRSREQAKERQDVQTIQKNRTDAQQSSDAELDREVEKWTRREE